MSNRFGYKPDDVAREQQEFEAALRAQREQERLRLEQEQRAQRERQEAERQRAIREASQTSSPFIVRVASGSGFAFARDDGKPLRDINGRMRYTPNIYNSGYFFYFNGDPWRSPQIRVRLLGFFNEYNNQFIPWPHFANM
jgi:hypothetical protein